jgi:hypothetical protein
VAASEPALTGACANTSATAEATRTMAAHRPACSAAAPEPTVAAYDGGGGLALAAAGTATAPEAAGAAVSR